ncbi:MAG: flavodoxin-dependent (E)-4-hydroxy-3-methylbut-2-enyl-diphosphate synthase [Candidatus Anammoxibacter sp.]
MNNRKKTKSVFVGSLEIGNEAKVAVQSMANTHTQDVESTVNQIKELEAIGCQIVRVAVPTSEAASCLSAIKKRINIPLVADIHFVHQLALDAIEQGVDKIRINPGNMKDKDMLKKIIVNAKNKGIPIRIGVNSGSIRQPIKNISKDKNQEEDLVDLMVNSTLDYCTYFESLGFRDIVVSLKTSDVPSTIKAYRLISKQCDYPLHIGVTAAGPPSIATVKSAIGIGCLLAEGIGDTLRVSFTGPPHNEVNMGFEILETLGLSERKSPEIISCPTCGRCEIDLEKIVNEVKERLPVNKKAMQIAIMGCCVNGPGEAMEADIGIAGGNGFGLLFKKGKKIKKVPESRMVTELLAEIDGM